LTVQINPEVLAALKSAVGEAGWIGDPVRLEPHLTEWRGLYRGETPLMLMPASTAEAARVVEICAAANVAMVPHGGNTGLTGGAIPGLDGRAEILLSAARLNRIRELDTANFTVTAEAGVVLQALQEAAAEAGLLFPLSLAAEGSCQLGGNISTNAGGTSVLRYGNTRDLVLGLEVVLPDGRVWEGLQGLRKDNTGYDLKQWFIGAEGTLGFVTAATVKLFPTPRSRATAWLATADAAAAVQLYSLARSRLGDELTACELLPRIAVDMVLEHVWGCRDPLTDSHPWYVLLEFASARDQAALDSQLVDFLETAMAGGTVVDGVVAASESQRDGLWRIRHAVSEAQKKAGASIKHDISVPLSRVADFLVAADAAVASALPGVRPVPFGHLGDGNLHYNLSQPVGMEPQAFLDQWDELNTVVHDLVERFGGSFSAEHGIGYLKVPELARRKAPLELELMRSLKHALDPQNLMNPGKVLAAKGP